MSQPCLRTRKRTDVDGDIADLGECFLKHTNGAVRAFRVSPSGSERTLQVDDSKQLQARPVVAVLPFRVYGAETLATSASICDLIAENVIHLIARNDQIAVTSWMSSRAFGDQNYSAVSAGEALGASWLVTGSAYLQGSELLLNAELIQTGDSRIEWSGRVRGDTRDLLLAESETTSEIAQSVIQRIVEVETRRVSKHALPNLASHSILTGAIGLMHRSGKDNFIKSRSALEYLLERHPRMHAVRPWLAQWYVLRNTRGFADDPKADASRALEQTNRALDALPDDSRAIALLGFTHFHLLSDAVTAEKFLDQSVAMNGNDPLAGIFCAAVKSVRQVVDEGWALSLHALKIAPFDPLRDYMRAIASGCAMSVGALDVAIELASASVRENSNHPYAWRVLLIARARRGQLVEARLAYEKLVFLQQDLRVSTYSARSKLSSADLQIAVDALRAVGVPE